MTVLNIDKYTVAGPLYFGALLDPRQVQRIVKSVRACRLLGCDLFLVVRRTGGPRGRIC